MRERLEAFLRKRGLEHEDIAKITGTFLIAKYSTWMAFAAGGVHYQPISRLLRRHYPHVRERVRDRLREKLPRQVKAEEPSSWLDATRIRAVKIYQVNSQKIADRFAQNRQWAYAAKLLAQDPRQMALGFAEGLILCKLTLPLHMPLELYLIVRYYQRKRQTPTSEDDFAALREIATLDHDESGTGVR